MKPTNRYAKAAGGRRRSGTKSARRKRQLICVLICLIICGGAGLYAFKSVASTEKKPIVLPTPTPVVKVTDMSGDETVPALPYGLYTEKYVSGLSQEDLWMEDFDDTRVPVTARGIYAPPSIYKDKINLILDIVDTTNVNCVVIDIKDDNGYITAKLDSELLRAKGNMRDVRIADLPGLVAMLKEHNVYCIARIVSFRDDGTVNATPEFGVRKTNGNMMVSDKHYWMNPFNEDVWEYLVEIGRAAAKAGFDEINFDYCRFPTDKAVKEADFGVELTAENKQAAITGFIKYACEQLKPLGVFVSVDVFGAIIGSTIDAASVGQNYAELSMYLDYICPMVYPSHYGAGYYNLKVPDAQPYDLVYHAMLDSKKALSANMAKGRCAVVRPWLQAFTASWVKGHIDYGSNEIAAQIRGTYDAGYNSWLLWGSGNYSSFKTALSDE